MPSMNRKEFLQTSASLLALTKSSAFFNTTKALPKLSFSTLGCPDWGFETIVEYAAAHGFQGIELRGIKRQMDLSKCPEFENPEQIAATLARLNKNKLQIVDLGSSCSLHYADAAKRKENLDEAKRFIDLASALHCPFIRVFPNNIPKEEDKQTVFERIASGLNDLGEYAKGSGVKVLMETHGELVRGEDLLTVMQLVSSKQAGLVWDIANMWTITKEAPADVYPKLKKWIFHIHIKDARLVDDQVNYVFLGQGEVPIFQAVDLLRADGYSGYYSLEWEKMWHPELAEPELAFADYAAAMKKHFEG